MSFFQIIKWAANSQIYVPFQMFTSAFNSQFCCRYLLSQIDVQLRHCHFSNYQIDGQFSNLCSFSNFHIGAQFSILWPFFQIIKSAANSQIYVPFHMFTSAFNSQICGLIHLLKSTSNYVTGVFSTSNL